MPKHTAPAPRTNRPEDESADPVGDGHSDAEFAAQVSNPARDPRERDDRTPGEHNQPVDPDQSNAPAEPNKPGDDNDELDAGPGRQHSTHHGR